MQHIQHIFFDLDGTLWDFHRSSQETLQELFSEYQPHIGEDMTFEDFLLVYRRINEGLWRRYEKNEINSQELRVERWEGTFKELGVRTGEWTRSIGNAYIDRCPKKPHLLPFAKEILEYLRPKFDVHIITNGFSETQAVKMEYAGLNELVGRVITSDEAEARKPDRKIFDYAMAQTGADHGTSLYIGDSYHADVLGGRDAGLNVVYFNPNQLENPHAAHEIQHLNQLQNWF